MSFSVCLCIFLSLPLAPPLPLCLSLSLFLLPLWYPVHANSSAQWWWPGIPTFNRLGASVVKMDGKETAELGEDSFLADIMAEDDGECAQEEGLKYRLLHFYTETHACFTSTPRHMPCRLPSHPRPSAGAGVGGRPPSRCPSSVHADVFATYTPMPSTLSGQEDAVAAEQKANKEALRARKRKKKGGLAHLALFGSTAEARDAFLDGPTASSSTTRTTGKKGSPKTFSPSDAGSPPGAHGGFQRSVFFRLILLQKKNESSPT